MTPRFDELIPQSTRLSIMSLLASADWAEFSFVRDALGLSDSALSKHFTALEEAGYIVLDRVPEAGRRRVRVRLTPEGEEAFGGHVAALRQIVDRAGAEHSF